MVNRRLCLLWRAYILLCLVWATSSLPLGQWSNELWFRFVNQSCSASWRNYFPKSLYCVPPYPSPRFSFYGIGNWIEQVHMYLD